VVLRKRGTTSSSAARGGRTSRPSCGQGSRRRREGGSGSGVWGTSWRMRGVALRCSTSSDHLRGTGSAASGGKLGQRRGRGGIGGGGGGDSERGGGGTRGVRTHGLLAVGFALCFLCPADKVWRVCGCAVRFPSVFSPWVDYFPFWRKGDEDAANEPNGTADRERIK